ncbi:hypothetical protein SAMN04487768_0902 [Burkholderia sp. b13]|nr:hypothetical protein SAMN04487768_0902 [Burkholderia sp. b13]
MTMAYASSPYYAALRRNATNSRLYASRCSMPVNFDVLRSALPHAA